MITIACTIVLSEKYDQIYFSVLDDYRIKFPNGTVNNFIDLGTINKSFNELTFSAWIKFNPGFRHYPLVSYITQSSTEIFQLAFRSDYPGGTASGEGSADKSGDTGGETIAKFYGNLFGEQVE